MDEVRCFELIKLMFQHILRVGSMEWKLKFRWHNPQIKPRNSTFVSITKGQGFSFSSQFMREHNLTDHVFVRFATVDDDDYIIGCQFSDDDDPPGPEWLQLQRKKSRNKQSLGETAQTKATSFINDNHILRKLVNQPKNGPEDSRFHIKFSVKYKVFVIQLIPSFERLISLNDLKDDDVGIYRLSHKEEVVYIGKGNLKQRIKQHKLDKDFDKIEVSFVPQEDKQLEYESFHLDRYKNKFGRLPQYNKISGHSVSKQSS